MRWSWGADLVAPAAQALMEATWLYAWALVIAATFKAARPGFAAMALLLALGAWSGRLSHCVPWRYPLNYLLLVPATIVILPLWLHAALLRPGAWSWSPLLPARNAAATVALAGTGVLGLYLWGRGMWIGVRPPSTGTLGKWLVGGAAAFLVLFALSAADHDRTIAPLAGRFELLILGYFILGLGVIAIVHTKTVHGRTPAGQPISLAWALALAIPIAAITALGLLLSGDLAPVVRAILAPVVRPILRSATAAALVLEKALLWIGCHIGHGLLMFLRWLSSLFPIALQNVVHRGPESLSWLSPLLKLKQGSFLHPDWNKAGDFSPLFLHILLGLILGLIAAGLAILYLRFLFRRSVRAGADAIEEERTSLWSWQLFRDQLQGVWAALFGRVRKGHEILVGWSATIIAGRADETEPADIREIYRRLLRWAAARGHRRQSAMTPHELLHRLSTAVPSASAALALITAHYERARYGDIEITGPTLAASQAASDQITTADNRGATARSHR